MLYNLVYLIDTDKPIIIFRILLITNKLEMYKFFTIVAK